MSHADAHAGRVIAPSALGGDWRRFLYLSTALALTELKIRFFDSVLGYLWSLLRPLLFFGVLYAVFSQIVPVGKDVEHYPVMLLLGVVLYTFFGEATGNGVEALVARENLLRKVNFPRMAIPWSVVLIAAFDLSMNLLATSVFALATGVQPRWSWLELPAALLLMGIWSTGVAMLLSVLFVRFRDIKPIWGVVVQTLFYITPILYPIEAVQARSSVLAHAAMCNPLAAINQQVRHAVVDPNAPTAAQAIGGAGRLLIPLTVVFGLFALGIWVFNRRAPQLAEEL